MTSKGEAARTGSDGGGQPVATGTGLDYLAGIPVVRVALKTLSTSFVLGQLVIGLYCLSIGFVGQMDLGSALFTGAAGILGGVLLLSVGFLCTAPAVYLYLEWRREPSDRAGNTRKTVDRFPRWIRPIVTICFAVLLSWLLTWVLSLLMNLHLGTKESLVLGMAVAAIDAMLLAPARARVRRIEREAGKLTVAFVAILALSLAWLYLNPDAFTFPVMRKLGVGQLQPVTLILKESASGVALEMGGSQVEGANGTHWKLTGLVALWMIGDERLFLQKDTGLRFMVQASDMEGWWLQETGRTDK